MENNCIYVVINTFHLYDFFPFLETQKGNVHVIGLQHEPKPSPAKKLRTDDSTVSKIFLSYKFAFLFERNCEKIYLNFSKFSCGFFLHSVFFCFSIFKFLFRGTKKFYFPKTIPFIALF